MHIDGQIFVRRILFIRSLRLSPFFPLSIEFTLFIVIPVFVSAKTVTLRYFTSLKMLSTLASTAVMSFSRRPYLLSVSYAYTEGTCPLRNKICEYSELK